MKTQTPELFQSIASIVALPPALACIAEVRRRPRPTELTPVQVENFLLAYEVMYNTPAERIDLGAWRYDKTQQHRIVSDEEIQHDCNTVGCIGGWLSSMSHFKKQGLFYDGRSIYIRTKDGPVDQSEASRRLFGVWVIFKGGDKGLLGKIQALERLRGAMNLYRLLTDQQNSTLHREEDRLIA